MTTIKLITLFERQAISFQSLALPDIDTFLDELDRINQTAGIELIKLERNGLRATQYVGIIQTSNYLFQILPKIDCDPDGLADAPIGSKLNDLAVTSATRNFMQLLSHAKKLKLHPQAQATLQTSHGTWLDLLTKLFSIELMTQLQQGFHQDYVRRDDMLPYVRGRWNIARQFVNHPNLALGLDVSYDDYSPDTLLNQVFHLAVSKMRYVTRDSNIRQTLANLEAWLQRVQLPVQLNSTDLARIEFTRLNERFEPAFQLAKLFLEGQTVHLIGGVQRAFAFVFDMDRLFEQFVANLLQSNNHRILPDDWVNSQIELQGGRPSKYLVQPPNSSENPLFLQKPDILLKSMGVPYLIIDTKNKALPIMNPYRSVAESDVLQMMAYAIEFRCPSILLLYPRTFCGTQSAPYLLSVENTPIRIFIATLDLHQPLVKLDKLINDFHYILDQIHMNEVNSTEVVWPV